VARLVLALAALCVCLLPGPAPAAAARVAVVMSANGPIYHRVQSSLVTSLANAGADSVTSTWVLPRPGQAPPAAMDDYRLIVAIGTKATRWALHRDGDTPVLSLLVPEVTFRALLGEAGAAGGHPPASAVYLDQPVERQLDLARIALPGVDAVGALLGPNSRHLRPALEQAARSRGLTLHLATVGPGERPLVALESLLEDSDLLLALPDPAVFNREDVQGILLTTYRAEVPVIGFSHAYVLAGALTAVYSTPAQIGRQGGELVAGIAAGGWRLPKPQYPKYYTVAVNHQVARSLRIDIDDGPTLQARLRALERPQ